MPSESLSASIQAALNNFDVRQFRASNLALLNALGYSSDRTQAIPGADPQAFRAIVESHSGKTLNADKAKFADWKQADLLFQFTDEELIGHTGLFQDAAINASQTRSYLFFAVELSGTRYSRTDLATIARQINRLFPMPVTVTFSYANKLSMVVINRRPHKRDESRDVLGHVSLIRDINLSKPHRAHLDVLQALSLPNRLKWADDHNKPRNFDGLLAAWLAVLDTEELNRQFYKDLFAWFERAVTTARFPTDEAKTLPPEEHVIRLITRLLFIWFIKEKGLIADDLFNETQVAGLLKHYDPDTGDSYYRAVLQNLFFATLNTEINKRGFSKETPTTHRDFSRCRYKADMHDPDKLVALFRRTPFINGGLFDCLDTEAATRDGGWRIDCFTDNPRSRSGYSIPNRLFFSRDKNNPGLITLFDKYKFTVEENTPAEQEVALDPELLGKVFENLLAAYNPETRDTARKQTGSYYTPRAVVDYMVDEALTAYLSETAHLPNATGPHAQKQQTAQPSTSAFQPSTSTFQPSAAPVIPDPPPIIPDPPPVVPAPPPVIPAPPPVIPAVLSGNPSAPHTTPWQQRIRCLLDYTDPFDDAEDLFTPTERDHIIQAIATIKVLDPAVGSGAFPMGILHKLTLALRRLDPDNTLWETLQKDLAGQKAASAFNTQNQQDRDAELNEISTTFERYRDSDFGRKLYLIQNSIYGVDVQPVASQIAKLRFFISLAIEQEPTGEVKDNYGIKPLPNLETRFVAANALLALEKPAQLTLGQTDVVTRLEQELTANRERHFHATTRTTKRKCRTKDKELRSKLAAVLQKAGFLLSAADKIANWDPYDQNAGADWFDPEYMFGVTKGFDVVIGNPPYVRADSGIQHLELRQRIEGSNQYETLWEKWDLYIPFIERGYKLLKHGGFTTLIVSDAYCHSKYAQKSQNWFLKHSRILRLDFFGKVKIFDAAVRNVTYLFQKVDGSRHKPERRVHGPEFGTISLLPTSEQRELTYRVFFPEDTDFQSFSVPTVTLDGICYISVGMVVHADEKRAQGAFELRDLVSDTEDELHPKPFVEGKHLARWLPATNKWLEWGTKRSPDLFRRPTFPEIYEVEEKLISVDMAAGVKKLRVAYDDQRLFHNHSAWSFLPWHNLSGVRNRSIKKQTRYRDETPRRPDLPQREELEKTSSRFAVKFLLGVMNSTVAHDFLKAHRRSNIHLYPDDWKKLPIPDVTPEQQIPIIELVDTILNAKRTDPTADTTEPEAEIDRLVYELYGLTKEEITAVEQQKLKT